VYRAVLLQKLLAAGPTSADSASQRGGPVLRPPQPEPSSQSEQRLRSAAAAHSAMSLSPPRCRV
jgi:hypothetical protein